MAPTAVLSVLKEVLQWPLEKGSLYILNVCLSLKCYFQEQSQTLPIYLVTSQKDKLEPPSERTGPQDEHKLKRKGRNLLVELFCLRG